MSRVASKTSDIKTKIEPLLKSRDTGAILQNLEDAEQRLADVRVNFTADKSRKSGTSPKRSLNSRLYKGTKCQKLDDNQETKSLPTERLSIHSQRDRIKVKYYKAGDAPRTTSIEETRRN